MPEYPDRLPVPGFEGIYDVTRDGRVISLERDIPRLRAGRSFTTRVPERQLKPHIDRYGYAIVSLQNGGKPWRAGIHRVVCLAYHGEPPEAGMHAAHIDGVKLHNVPENVRWATVAENNEDRRTHGVHPMGERLPHTKLTAEKVREVGGYTRPERRTPRLLSVSAYQTWRSRKCCLANPGGR